MIAAKPLPGTASPGADLPSTPAAAPPVVTVLNPEGRSAIVLVCEHASNFIPADYDDLGLPVAELQRHIAWDIGAEAVTRRLSRLLDAPAVIAGWSRLLIDGNRPLGTPSSIPEISEATVVPGNRALSADQRAARATRFFKPFHDRLAAFLDQRLLAGLETRLVAIHSFTPAFLGVARPWHAGILFDHSDAWGRQLVAALDRPDRPVVANEPYRIEPDTDYLAPVHGQGRGLETVLVELRQDLVASVEGQDYWAGELAGVLKEAPPTRKKR
ncbi:N-formylglutamate amidohydrolase [Phreatobacter stygius]|uniref:N-formylglutamate amidohydrolase n=1 Tax=Phreatobacter stygius TaxID=1940610 RepID=A0A4D7BB48_9HYPH|nr:N-formylglutamate amidohydrolase [Phreatobacter stygius]QCI67860.1 N-formylglutamate amidohydrolase [Phreatobacter stygius]